MALRAKRTPHWGSSARTSFRPTRSRAHVRRSALRRRPGRHAVMLAGGTDLIVDRHLAAPGPAPSARPIDLVVDLTAIEELDARRGRNARRKRVARPRRRRHLPPTARGCAHPRSPRGARCHGARGRCGADPDARHACRQHRERFSGGRWCAGPPGARRRFAARERRRRAPRAALHVLHRIPKNALAPDEIIAAIEVRLPPENAVVRFRKVGTRLAQAISKVALASAIEVEGGTIRRARFGMAVGRRGDASAHPGADVPRGQEARRRGARRSRRGAGRRHPTDRRRPEHGRIPAPRRRRTRLAVAPRISAPGAGNGAST